MWRRSLELFLPGSRFFSSAELSFACISIY